MKIFISMGFNGRTDLEVLRRRDEIINIIKSKWSEIKDEDIMDNFVKDIPSYLEDDHRRVWCLGDSIRIMAEADLIIFDHDYNKFTGCRMEHAITREYLGLNIGYITPDDTIDYAEYPPQNFAL